MDNLIGKRLDGRYSIESLVGVGGMANVYRGTDLKTGNQIAVKVLKDEFLDNEELVRRFKNESKAISILSHPNIVKVYDVSVTDKLQYIVMEYVDGITLKEYLKQRGGALTWKETVHFATQILSALQHAHSKGIIHRDVKPQNIMLLADGSIKMMDFGIARFSRAQSQTVSDKAIGSVHYISPEQALLTLDRELGADKNLEATRKRGAETWNALLGRIAVEGGTDEEIRTFYSCLFRANLFSRKFYERDAEGNPYYYSPYDGKVHAGYMYTDNGFWDTFRSQFPLTNILHPTMQGRYMNALLAAQEQCGWLPSWSAPGETGGMIGNHAISLLTDAWAKGIRTFDPQKALEAYAKEAMNKGPWGGANGRAGWKEYWQLGYVSYPESMGSTAQTLEYAYDDFCGYQLARMTGNKFYEEIFSRVMYNYRNVFDKESGFMRGRLKDGSWLAPFDPYEWGGPYCEGNAWHYNWSVFHDVQGLINLYGSDEAFTAKIDSVFTVPNVIRPGTYGGMIHEMKEMELAGMGQYAHGNQPIQHMIYLYSYAGQPWKTQYWSRQITGRLYNSSERGYLGDEDQGGMSSWYILSSLGIYSVCPGTDQYVLGSPVFRKATITMEDGRKFVIEADGNSQQNVYIQSATLNGKPLDKNYITYKDIADGGVMRLVMGPEPNKERGTGKDAAPFSLSRPE